MQNANLDVPEEVKFIFASCDAFIGRKYEDALTLLFNGFDALEENTGQIIVKELVDAMQILMSVLEGGIENDFGKKLRVMDKANPITPIEAPCCAFCKLTRPASDSQYIMASSGALICGECIKKYYKGILENSIVH